MANSKNLNIKATVVVTPGGDVIVSVGKENNFADDLTIDIEDTAASTDNDNATGLRLYPTGTQTDPTISFTPALALDDNWTFNLVFTSTDGKERLDFKFTGYQDSSKRVSFVVDSSLKVRKTQ